MRLGKVHLRLDLGLELGLELGFVSEHFKVMVMGIVMVLVRVKPRVRKSENTGTDAMNPAWSTVCAMIYEIPVMPDACLPRINTHYQSISTGKQV